MFKYSTIILGDFNLPLIDWSNNSSPHDNVHDTFLDCFRHLGMTQFVTVPTRYNSKGDGNILDIILCNNCMAVKHNRL